MACCSNRGLPRPVLQYCAFWVPLARLRALAGPCVAYRSAVPSPAAARGTAEIAPEANDILPLVKDVALTKATEELTAIEKAGEYLSDEAKGVRAPSRRRRGGASGMVRDGIKEQYPIPRGPGTRWLMEKHPRSSKGAVQGVPL